MIWYWISFSVVFLFIPIGLASLSVYFQHKNDIVMTPELKKHRGEVIAKYTLIYWIFDLFYMACFIDNDICKYVFGCLLVAMMFMNSAMVFLQKNNSSTFEKYLLLLDFLIAIGISIYLLYIVPDKDLQTILITVVSCIFGGMFTLLGVAWTIRKSDADRKETEKAKAKPYFTFNKLNKEPNITEAKCSFVVFGEENRGCSAYTELENSNMSVIKLSRIRHDGEWYELEANTVLLPGNKTILNFRFDNLLNIYLEVSDIFGNPYYYRISVLVLNAPSSDGKIFHTVRGIDEVKFEDIEKNEREVAKCQN